LFQIFAELDNEELMKQASIFLFKIVNFNETSEEFKKSLLENDKLKPLIDSEYYDEKVLKPETNEYEALNLEDLCISAGFA